MSDLEIFWGKNVNIEMPRTAQIGKIKGEVINHENFELVIGKSNKWLSFQDNKIVGEKRVVAYQVVHPDIGE